jgi:hypothetical protein
MYFLKINNALYFFDNTQIYFSLNIFIKIEFFEIIFIKKYFIPLIYLIYFKVSIEITNNFI